MANYKKIIVTTNSYSVTDMVSGTTPICDTKVLSGSSWGFTASELPATVYYETTETPKTKRLLLATDTDHIEDRTGRTAEQINRVFYKNMCKEFTSSGTDIVVNNGMDGYVLSGKLEGQTVKNYADWLPPFKLDSQITSFVGKKIAVNGCTIVNKYNKEVLITFEDESGTWLWSKTVGANRYYTITETDLKNKKGYLKQIDAFVNKGWDVNTELEYFSEKMCLLIDDVSKKDILTKATFGLNSTQAVVYNNGIKYSFYMPVIQGTTEGLVPTITFNPVLPTLVMGDVLDLATKTITFANASKRVLTDEELKAYLLYRKVICLRKVEEVADTFEVKEDGSGAWIEASNDIILKDNYSIIQKEWTSENFIVYQISTNLKADALKPSICSTFDYTQNSSLSGKMTSRWFTIDGYGNVILCLEKNSYPTIDSVKNLIKISSIGITYPLSTPIVKTIPKEIIPTILTQATNTFQFGEGVAPSSVSINVPVNKMADLETRLAQLEAVITSASNLSLMGNYVDDEYNDSLNQL